ncbi:electron transport complex subunit RsxE [Clostridium aminobutyricum]|uniref:Ion-translocating oxidoreductase complex subunit E n=1 Tax=Clostridium aminobutyricum TaxID=33953 RepID=A0A939IJ35_CLOAM|nr:electron transport complex subunit E [Clostridium aminobutyricum]MBN7773203.1 electron transport complex subunit E [Clostridium aminobutyricum]
MSKLGIITKGIIKENPTLVLLLGTCPTLAVTTSVLNGLGMGIAAMAVLICSNVAISMLKNIIPDKVRIPCYVVVIAGFVTCVQFLVKAYALELDKALGIFIPLIVVNCVILGRAEMFANKNSVIDSALDGVGMGIGFTCAFGLMGFIREVLGSGTVFNIPIFGDGFTPMAIFMLAPGGFFAYSILVAGINFISKGKAIKKKEFGCAGCAMCGTCQSANKGGCE